MKLKNALMQLFIENMNAQPRTPLTVKNEGDEATVFIYDAIGGYFGIDAQEFAVEFAKIDASVINLRINSPGGDVFDARAMQTTIAQHPAKVIAHIDGLAASAATYLCAPCDQVIIAQGAGYMIHNGWSLGIGNRHDHLQLADLLEQVDAGIANDYLNLTNDDIDLAKINAWMDAEKWFTADEAVANGFATSVFNYADTTENKKTWNLSAYNNLPAWMETPTEDPKESAKAVAAAQRAANDRKLRLLERAGS